MADDSPEQQNAPARPPGDSTGKSALQSRHRKAVIELWRRAQIRKHAAGQTPQHRAVRQRQPLGS